MVPLTAAGRVAGKKIVSARACMSINDAEGRRLCAQISKYPGQNGVFMNVGEITGVKRVAVIHPLCPLAEFCARRFARAGTPWTSQTQVEVNLRNCAQAASPLDRVCSYAAQFPDSRETVAP